MVSLAIRYKGKVPETKPADPEANNAMPVDFTSKDPVKNKPSELRSVN